MTDEELIAYRKKSIANHVHAKQKRAVEKLAKDFSSKQILEACEEIITKRCKYNIFQGLDGICHDLETGNCLCDSLEIIKPALGKEDHITCRDCVENGFCTLHNIFWLEMDRHLFELNTLKSKKSKQS